MAKSARLFVKGPVWAAAAVLNVVLTGVAVLEALRGGQPWMLLFIAALVLVGASFYSFHRGRVAARDRAQSLPNEVEGLIAKGMDLLEELNVPMSPPYLLAPDAKRMDQSLAFCDRARELLIDARRPSLLPDLTAGINSTLRRYRQEREAQDEELERQAEKGERTSAGERLKLWADAMHRRPAVLVEGCLAGLADVRKKL
jgi:hypothetical protein